MFASSTAHLLLVLAQLVSCANTFLFLPSIPNGVIAARTATAVYPTSSVIPTRKSLYSSSSANQSDTPLGLNDADRIFDSVDLDGSGTVDREEFKARLAVAGYSEDTIESLFSTMDRDQNGEISRGEFCRSLKEPTTVRDADLIFNVVDLDSSGTIDIDELKSHLLVAGYGVEEIERLFYKMDTNNDGLISKTEFRRAILDDKKEDGCPRGYFLNSVKQTCERLGPVGRLSQRVETSGPFKRTYNAISNLFGMDTKQISKLGISFALSYSIVSNINGALSLSIAWYISSMRTGLSPLLPGQWRSLLSAYGMIYGLIQILRPFRVAAAIGMSKLSAEYLEMTQAKLQCSRSVAIGLQYTSGLVMMGLCAFFGVNIASILAGVAIWG